MSNWNPALYGKFLEWRTRPSLDLAARVNIEPRTIVDLGCGPGNSTAVCAERWPGASIVGVDSSPEMIAAARAARPDLRWEVGDIGGWESGLPADLIFSNAALQWVPDHRSLFPRLMRKLAPGGVLAAQMPSYEVVPNRFMREMAASDRWRQWFPEGRANEWRSHPLEFYYEVLAPCAKRLDLWATDYLQIISDVDGIVDWYKSTGLRPYLERIGEEGQRQEFLAEFRSRLDAFYPKLEAGGVPFMAGRIFIVAGL